MKKSGTQVAIEVLDKMLAMPDKELRALVKNNSKEPQHWSTPILEELGYFDRLAKEMKIKRSKK